MALPKLYEQITWVNDTTPALNEDNLNAMSQALDDIDDRVIDLAGTIMEDVPQILEDMEILGPAVENIDENVARAEAAAESAEQYAEEIAPPIEVVKDFAPIITIADAINKPVKDLKVKVDAVQDLHGYTKPWVYGAGKNLINMTVSGIKSANTEGTWSGNAYTLNGVVFTLLTDSDDNITGVNINGPVPTPTDIAYINLGTVPFDSSKSYFMSGGLADKQYLVVQGMGSLTDMGSGRLITNLGETKNIQFVVRNATNNVKLYPQVEIGTSASTFESPSNICSITGHSQAKVTRAGRNLLKNTLVSRTENAITFTHNSDDTVTANGGPASGNCIVEIGQFTGLSSVFLSGCPSGGNLVNTYNVQLRDVTTSTWGQWDLGDGVQIDGLDKSHTYSVYIIVRSGYTANNVVFKPMISIERGAYEPYQGTVYTIDLDGTRYDGTLDVDAGTLTLTKGAITIDGNTNIQPNGFTSNSSHFGLNITGKANGTNNFITDRFFIFSSGGDPVGGVNGRAASTFVEFFLPTSVAQTTAAGQAWFADNPTTVVYELATPQTITLTPTEVELLWEYNTLFADTGDLSLTYDASGVLRIANAKLDIDTFKSVVAASSDFADFKTRVAAL